MELSWLKRVWESTGFLLAFAVFMFGLNSCSPVKKVFTPSPPREIPAETDETPAENPPAEKAQAEIPVQPETQSSLQAEVKKSNADFRKSLKSSIRTMEDAYYEKEYDRAQRKLTTILDMMENRFATNAEKLDYLDRNFRPGQRGLTYTIIAEDLAWRTNSTAPQEIDQTQTIQKSLAKERAAEEKKKAANGDADTITMAAPSSGSKSPSLPPPPPPEKIITPTYTDLQNREEAVFVAPDSTIETYFDPQLRRFIQLEIRKVAIQMGEPRNFQLPDDFVKEIEYFIRRFQTVPYYREFFENALRRSRKYIPALRRYFLEKGFPEEIMYLAFIESGFNPVAVSKSKAVGMFQFMAPTAEEYGLRIRRYTDERYSPIKSAIACRDYLHDLQLELGSFTLALSSYNSGSGKTRRALKQLENFKDRSFWALREQTDALHQETRIFVPQIFAIIVMAKPGHPPKFGIPDVPFPTPGSYRTVIVPSRMPLMDLANEAGIPVAELIRLNPDLKPNALYTPSRTLDYPLFVPAPKVKPVARAVDSEMSQRRQAQPKEIRKTEALPPDDAIYHRIKMGDNLYNLAQEYGVSLEELMEWNNLSNNNITAGEYLVIYPKRIPADRSVRGTEPQRVTSVNREFPVRGVEDFQNTENTGQEQPVTPTGFSNEPQQQPVVVDSTETLGDMILRKVSEGFDAFTQPVDGAPQQVQQNNGGGQQPQRQSQTIIATTEAVDSNPATDSGEVTYEIIEDIPEATGETEGDIEEIVEASAATPSNEPIPPAFDLYVLDEQSIAAGETFLYKVARGNTLGIIANLFGVSVSNIKRWNGLRSGTIRVGQKLKIVAQQYIKFYKYRVQIGDNLSDIANHFGSSVRTLRIANGKSNTGIKEGEVLSIFGI